jgi:hypothetical protein
VRQNGSNLRGRPLPWLAQRGGLHAPGPANIGAERSLVGLTGCEHPWPCYGKPAIIFHDRGKIFTSERARQVLVDRLGIITEQAPPYAPSAKGTVENLFRWMTQRFERRQPSTSHGINDAKRAAEAGGMTLEELERCFYQAIVDDYQQEWDELRRQRHCVLWEHAVAQSGIPQ